MRGSLKFHILFVIFFCCMGYLTVNLVKLHQNAMKMSHLNEEESKEIVENGEIKPQCLPPIIIGGSSGSGTRGAVLLLANLGVHFLVDNGGTDDIEVGNWTGMVYDLLIETKGELNYRLEDLSPVVRDNIINHLKKSFEHRNISCFVKDRGFGLYGLRSWGFKSPDSIFFIPFWNLLFPGFMFIHVVRDGRDMAWGNPVDGSKYYNYLYSGTTEKSIPPTLTFDRRIQSAICWQKINLEGRLSALRHLSSDRYHIFISENTAFPETYFAEIQNFFPIVTWQRSNSNVDGYRYVVNEWMKYSPHKSIQNYACCSTMHMFTAKLTYGRWALYSQRYPAIQETIENVIPMGLQVFGAKFNSSVTDVSLHDRFTKTFNGNPIGWKEFALFNYSQSCKELFKSLTKLNPNSFGGADNSNIGTNNVFLRLNCPIFDSVDFIRTYSKGFINQDQYLPQNEDCELSFSKEIVGGDITSFYSQDSVKCCEACRVSGTLCTHFSEYQGRCYLKVLNVTDDEIKETFANPLTKTVYGLTFGRKRHLAATLN